MTSTNKCQVGQVLPGGYMVKEALGEGGYGYVCYAQKEGQDYAVKVQEANLSAYTEASLLNVLNHPNIIKPVETLLVPNPETVFDPANPFRSLIPTNDIFNYFYIYQPRGSPQLPPDVNLLTLLFRLLSALAYLESNGIIHCDLKPANIVFLGSEPILIDFGVCEFSPGSERLESLVDIDSESRERHINQTSWYRAPEMWRQQAYDSRIDVFSLGCCLYRWLSGRPLFTAETLIAFELQFAQVPTKIATLMTTLKPTEVPYRSYYQQLLEIMLSPHEERAFASHLVTVMTGLAALSSLDLVRPVSTPPDWLYPYPLGIQITDNYRQDILRRITNLLNEAGIARSMPVEGLTNGRDDDGILRQFSIVELNSRLLNDSAWSILIFSLVQQLINMVGSRPNYLGIGDTTLLYGGQGQISNTTIPQAVALAVYLVTHFEDAGLFGYPLSVAKDLAEFYAWNNNCIFPKILLNRHNFVSEQAYVTSLSAKVIPAYIKNIAMVKWDSLDESQARALLKTEAGSK